MQTILSFDGCSQTGISPETKFNSSGKPRNRIGRAPTYLTSSELTEIMQQYYFSSNPEVKQRIMQRFDKKKIKSALAICKLDIGKQGRIGRYSCGLHGKKFLVYNWLGSEDGCRIRCFSPGGCRTNTHMDGYLFAGADSQFEDAAEM